jgi:hypothetical protein
MLFIPLIAIPLESESNMVASITLYPDPNFAKSKPE